MIVGIIKFIYGFLRPEEVGIHCLLHGIPLFDTDEHIPPAQEPEHSTDLSGVGDLTMYEIVFDQSPDLPVQHPVKLCEQNHIIAIMSVLGEEGQPGTPIRRSVFPGVKKQLRLVYVDLNLSLPEPAAKML